MSLAATRPCTYLGIGLMKVPLHLRPQPPEEIRGELTSILLLWSERASCASTPFLSVPGEKAKERILCLLRTTCKESGFMRLALALQKTSDKEGSSAVGKLHCIERDPGCTLLSCSSALRTFRDQQQDYKC
jgi:hypothetical protein